MTLLEIMVVLAIMGSAYILVRYGFRSLTKADLVESATDLAAVMRRASQLAVEKGELHRVVFDFDKQGYIVEECHGDGTIKRNELVTPDQDAAKRALDKGQQRLQMLAATGATGVAGAAPMQGAADPDAATRRAIAIGGAHLADHTCAPASDPFTGDSTGRGWARALPKSKGIRFREIWVQHRDESVTAHTKPQPQVAVYFWPNGSSEKAVIELTDGDPDRPNDGETFSILVFGLTGHIDLLDGVLRDVNDHMMRNVMGDHEARREDQK